LRALYFLIAGMIGRMVYLRSGLAILLTLIGAKMIVGELVEIPIWITLGAVVVIIGGATVLSVLVPPAARPAAEVGVPDPLQVLTRPRRRRREEHAARRS
jgi:tellurite resistance protein TerC